MKMLTQATQKAASGIETGTKVTLPLNIHPGFFS